MARLIVIEEGLRPVQAGGLTPSRRWPQSPEMTVYSYDLVPKRSRRFTPEMDAYLRAMWFPGLGLAQISSAFSQRFTRGRRAPQMMERLIANRMSELGLRNRMTGEAKCLGKR